MVEEEIHKKYFKIYVHFHICIELLHFKKEGQGNCFGLKKIKKYDLKKEF